MNHRGKLTFSATSADRQSATTQSSPIKKLQPIDEPINGLPAYRNALGETFTVRTVSFPKGFETPVYRIEIKQVEGEKGYKVLGTVAVKPSSVYIQDIYNNEALCPSLHAKPERKGYGFFELLLNQVKSIAHETGIGAVSLIPANGTLRAYYARFGFNTENDLFGAMKLEVAKPKADQTAFNLSRS